MLIRQCTWVNGKYLWLSTLFFLFPGKVGKDLNWYIRLAELGYSTWVHQGFRDPVICFLCTG